MSNTMNRLGQKKFVQLTNNVTSTPAIEVAHVADLSLLFPLAWTTCNLTFFTLYDESSPEWLPVHTPADVPVAMVATKSSAKRVSEELYPLLQIKIVTDEAANNAVNVQLARKS